MQKLSRIEPENSFSNRNYKELFFPMENAKNLEELLRHLSMRILPTTEETTNRSKKLKSVFPIQKIENQQINCLQINKMNA